MKKPTKPQSTLPFRRETIRVLDAQDLSAVSGGSTIWCATVVIGSAGIVYTIIKSGQ